MADEDPRWREEAKCRLPSVYEWLADLLGLSITEVPDVWFPVKHENASATARIAKTVCLGNDDKDPCPVLFVCREYAITRNERFGVWGGMSEVERTSVRRHRRKVERQRGMKIRRTQ